MPLKPKERKERGAELMKALDLTRVGEAIRFDPEGDPDKPWTTDNDDLDLVSNMVCAAGERWLAEDLGNLPFIKVQQMQDFAVDGVKLPVRQVLDLVAYGSYEEDKPILSVPPVLIVDWKATYQEVDTRWASRQSDSWQGKVYLHTTGAERFLYRGVDAKCQVREVPVNPNPFVVHHIIGCETIYDALLGMYEDLSATGPWPMNKPRSCWYGQQKCQFFDDCHMSYKGAHPPNGAIKNRRYLSPSFLSNLLACPEKARREEVMGEVRAATFEMKMGRAFDRGVSEMWRQAFGERCIDNTKENSNETQVS